VTVQDKDAELTEAEADARHLRTEIEGKEQMSLFADGMRFERHLNQELDEVIEIEIHKWFNRTVLLRYAFVSRKTGEAFKAEGTIFQDVKGCTPPRNKNRR